MLGFQLSLRPPDAVESELRQYIFHVNFRNDASQTACYEAIVRHHQFIHYNRESLDVFIQIGEEKRKISAGSDFFGYGTIRAGVEYEFGIYFSRVERDKLKKSGGDVAAFEARSRFFGSALDEVKVSFRFSLSQARTDGILVAKSDLFRSATRVYSFTRRYNWIWICSFLLFIGISTDGRD